MTLRLKISTLLADLTRHRIALCSVAIGLSLLVLSVPRVFSAAISSSAPIVMFDISQGQPVAAARILEAERDIEHALPLGVDRASLYAQLSFLRFFRVNNSSLPEAETIDALQAILRSTEAALRRRPADAYLWTRYAHVQYLLTGLGPYTLAALEQSYVYGPREPELIRFRMELSLAHWERLPKSLQTRALKQLVVGSDNPKIWGRFWGHFLSTLSPSRGEELLNLMRDESMDANRANLVANRIRDERNSAEPLNGGGN